MPGIIKTAVSDLLTFDISIGPGPISSIAGINWEFSLSNELTFYDPGQSGYNDGGFSNSFDIGVTSSSTARDFLVADSFDFSYEKRGGILPGVGVDGINVAAQNVTDVDYESWRDTTINADTVQQFGLDGDDRDFFVGLGAEVETELLGRDFLPGFDFFFATT